MTAILRGFQRGLLAAMVVATAAAEVPGLLAIRNARIYTGAGQVIERATVVVRDGLIESVGPNATVPPGAWVEDGTGMTVYPGFTNALTTWGLPAAEPAVRGSRTAPAPPSTTPPAQGPEDRPRTTSWLHAQDLLQPGDRNFADARSAGFTTAAVFPPSGIITGHGALMNLAGEKPGAMMAAESIGLYHTLSFSAAGGYPGSLLGVFAYLRQTYLDADYYKAAKAAYDAAPRGHKRPEYDRALEGVLEAKRILLPASRALEVRRLITFSKELKRPVILYGGHESYAAVEDLRVAGIPILIDLAWPERSRDADPETKDSLRTLTVRDQAPGAPAALAKAGVPFAFYGTGKPADVRKAVNKAIVAGLSKEDAVRALTLWPARIYGVEDRLGSIEPGKIANLTVTRGDWFDEKTKVQFVVIDGVKYAPTEPAGGAATGE